MKKETIKTAARLVREKNKARRRLLSKEEEETKALWNREVKKSVKILNDVRKTLKKGDLKGARKALDRFDAYQRKRRIDTEKDTFKTDPGKKRERLRRMVKKALLKKAKGLYQSGQGRITNVDRFLNNGIDLFDASICYEILKKN